MPKYFMDLHQCGTITMDEEGRQWANLAAARSAAVQGARGIMCGELTEGHLCLDCYIEIRNEDRTSVEKLLFADAVRVTGRRS